ncbi:MAG: serine hydrolase domain-containing protein [Chloroflexota bacterium]
MKRLLIWPMLLVTALYLTAVSSHAQSRWEHSNEADAFVQARMEALGIPGAALAVVQADEIVHLKGYGIANGAGDAVTPQTPFLLASLTKSITAVAVLQLMEAGLVDLDMPIQHYLPWFIPDTPITVRQLLNQTSGLDEAQGYDRNLFPDDTHALEKSIRQLAATDLNRPPGTAFEYSNSNYDVLGLLVETVSGQSYGTYIENQLFDPLQMRHSYVSLSDARAGGMSSSYYPFFGRPIAFDSLLPYSRATQPSAGLIGSAEDMAHYLQFHLNNGRFHDTQLLAPASMSLLHEAAVATNPDAPEASHYAMGWVVWPFTDAAPTEAEPPLALSHGGQWLGANHIMLLIPEKSLGMVLLLNSTDPTRSSAYSNIAFDLALLALGQPPQNYPPQEDWLTRQLRPLSIGLVIFLLLSGTLAIWRLRQNQLLGRDEWWFATMTLLDIGLIGYLLLIRLPQNNTSVRQLLRFEPDLGLMLILILLLTIGWGGVRTLWVSSQRRQS